MKPFGQTRVFSQLLTHLANRKKNCFERSCDAGKYVMDVIRRSGTAPTFLDNNTQGGNGKM